MKQIFTILQRHILLFAAASLVFSSAAASPTAEESVMITQVYGGGGNSGATYTHDYVELFNSSNQDVSLQGWSLQYIAADNALSTSVNGSFSFSATATIKARSFFLIKCAGGSNGESLPPPDTFCSINIAAGSGKILLAGTTDIVTLTDANYHNVAHVVDLVAFGNNTSPAGISAVGALSATKAAKRILENGVFRFTFNSVAGDFEVATPNVSPAPRNAQTPPVPEPPFYLSKHVVNFGNSILGSNSTTDSIVLTVNDLAVTLTFSVTSNEGVFTVDRSGIALDAGRAHTIKITFAPTEAKTYNGTLTISGSEINVVIPLTGNALAGQTYELVTSADQLTAGAKYLVVGIKNAADYFALGRQNPNNRSATPILPLNEHTIVAAAASANTDSAPYELTLRAANEPNAWVLSDDVNGSDLGPAKGQSRSNNYLRPSAATPVWTISFDQTKAVITCVGSEANTDEGGRNVIRYNPVNGLFSCYLAASQKEVYLYKSTAVVLASVRKTIDNIDFGDTEVELSVSQSFTIIPTHLTSNLTLTAVTFDDNGEESETNVFEVTPEVVGANVTNLVTVTVTFAPAEAQFYAGQLTISGGGLAQSALIRLEGEGREAEEYSIVIIEPTNGRIVVTENANPVASGSLYPFGTELTIVAVPNDGYVLNALTVNEQEIAEGEPYLLEEDIVIAAQFVAGNGIVAGDGSTSADFSLADRLQWYPNPVDKLLYINTQDLAVTHLEIIDQQGIVVLQQTYTGGAVNLEQLSTGIYFLSLQTTQGTITKKISKR